MTAWTNEEDLFLAENCEYMTNKELAEKLGRTEGAVANRLNLLFLKRCSTIYAYYKGDEYQRSGTIKELAEYYGVKEGTIRYYASPTYAKRGVENGYGRIRGVRV